MEASEGVAGSEFSRRQLDFSGIETMQADQEAGRGSGIRSTAIQMLVLGVSGAGQLAEGGEKL